MADSASSGTLLTCKAPASRIRGTQAIPNLTGPSRGSALPGQTRSDLPCDQLWLYPLAWGRCKLAVVITDVLVVGVCAGQCIT